MTRYHYVQPWFICICIYIYYTYTCARTYACIIRTVNIILVYHLELKWLIDMTGILTYKLTQYQYLILLRSRCVLIYLIPGYIIYVWSWFIKLWLILNYIYCQSGRMLIIIDIMHVQFLQIYRYAWILIMHTCTCIRSWIRPVIWHAQSSLDRYRYIKNHM